VTAPAIRYRRFLGDASIVYLALDRVGFALERAGNEAEMPPAARAPHDALRTARYSCQSAQMEPQLMALEFL
jgi:hypothetical protein